MSDPNNLVYREQLDDNVIDMLSEDIGSNYSLRTENTKTIASALNEIRGKDIIANAVGDPLLSTDSYNDMGSKIRQMTNEFKTQLINKGVTISSYDKLNSLINKINEIVGDGNSGIQVATGIVNSNSSSEWFARTSSGRINAYRVESSNLSFKPNLVIIYYNDGTNNKINSIGFGDTHEFIYNNISGVTSSSDTWYAGMLEPNYNDSVSGTSGTIIPKFNDNGFLFYTGIPSTEFTYLAYGLGESQSDALTESLKQILVDNGAIVEGNESLAELVVKIDGLITNMNTKEENTRNKLAGLMKDGGYDITGEEDIDSLLELLTISGIKLDEIKQIDGGFYHTFILKNDGSLWSCGYNAYGQLGLGDTSKRTVFTQVTTNINNDVKQLVCGYYYTFIIKNDGSLWACGRNEYGQLGLGDTNQRTTFTKVTTNINNDVKQVACGNNHTFILKNDGSVYSCGYNIEGQLGLGTSDNTDTHSTFTQVITNINNDVKQVACGYFHTIILKNDGSIWSCGGNNRGQLGIGTRDTDAHGTFTQVTTNINNDVKQVDCGDYHTFILKNDGSIWSCGYNDAGQLGLGDTTNKTAFTQITTNINNDVKQIACGSLHTFILKNNGSIWSCGYNAKGQLGIGTSETNAHSTFTQVTTNINNDVKQIASAYEYTFIIKNDGNMWVCGLNANGQLGLGDTIDRTTFTQIPRGVY